MSHEPPGAGAEAGMPARQSHFFDDVFRLATGTAAVQAVTVLSAPVLARLFDPAAFGVAALFASLTGIVSTVVCLRYELAIVLPEADADAVNLLAGSVLISTAAAIVSIPAVWLGGPWLAATLKAPELLQYLWLVPPILLLGGIGAGHPGLNSWAARTRRFTQLSGSRVVGTLSSTVSKLAAGLLGFNSAGSLIGGTVLGALSSPLLLGWQVWRGDWHLFRAHVRLPEIRRNLLRYRKFPQYNTVASLLNAASWQVPPFLLAMFFSTTVVGYYAVGNQVISIPMFLVGESVAQVFHVHASAAAKAGGLDRIVEDTFRKLADFSFFPILMLGIVGRELVVLAFGPTWSEAGVYLQILSLWLCFWFVSSPMARLYSILERNEFALGMNVIVLATRILSIWAGSYLGSPRLALLIFSVSGAVVYGYQSASIIRIAGVAWSAVGGILLNNLAVFAPAAGVMLALGRFRAPATMQILAAVLLVLLNTGYRLGQARQRASTHAVSTGAPES